MFNIEGNFITYNGRRFAVFLPVTDHTQHDEIIYELLGIERRDYENEIERLRETIENIISGLELLKQMRSNDS